MKNRRLKPLWIGALLCSLSFPVWADGPVGEFIYATSNHASDGLVKFDVGTFRRLATIALPNALSPRVLGVDANQRHVYVDRGPWDGKHTIDVVDTATDTISRSFDMPVPAGYKGRVSKISFMPDGSKAFVSLTDAYAVLMFNGDLTRKLGVIDTRGMTSWGGTLSPDGAWLYVPNFSSNSLTIINTASGVVQGVPGLPDPHGHPVSLVVNPDGKTLYVSQAGAPDGLLVLQPNAAHDDVSLVKHLAFTETHSGELQLSRDGRTLYHLGGFNTMQGDAPLYVIDTATYAIKRQLVGALSTSATLTMTPDGNRLIAGQPTSDYFHTFAPLVSIDPASALVSAKVDWQPDESQNGNESGYTSFGLVDALPACR